MLCQRLAASLLLMFCAHVVAAAQHASFKAGMPLEDALDSLRASGLRLVYSSVMVPATLTVTADVASDDLVAVARELLRPHGLRLRSLGSGLLAVVKIPDGLVRKVSVLPSPEDVPLEEVTVVASRFSYQDGIATPFVLDRASILAQPKIGEDALQSVARLPGMAFSGVSGKPNVRGGEAGETLVLLDGMPIREPYHMPDYNSAFSVLDENLVARLTTYTGPVPARYGNRLSAVLDLESVAPDMPARHAVALSSFNARLRTGGGTGDQQWSWLASGRTGTLGQWLSKAAPDVGEPGSSDAFLKIAGDFSGTAVQARALLSRSRFEFVDADTGENAVLRNRNAYTWIAAQRAINADDEVGVLLGHSSIDSHRSGVVAGGLTPRGALRDARSAQIWDAQLYGRWRFTSRHTLDAGLSFAAGSAHYDYSSSVEYVPAAMLLFSVPAMRTRDIALSAHRDLLGVYVSDKWQIAQPLYLELGARLERDISSAQVRGTHLGPRLAARWNLDANTALRISWGRAFQVAEAHELRVEDGEIAFGAAQRVDQGVVSFERRFSDGPTLRIEAFDRRMPHPRTRYENTFDPLRVLPELSADRMAIAPIRSRMRGVEMSAQWERGPWSVWSAYTWSKSRDVIDSRWQLRDWDQRSTLATSVAWQHGPWAITVQGAWRSGRPTTPFLDEDLSAPALGLRNSRKFPGHATIDARVARRFELGAGSLLVYAQVTNLLNGYNQCCTELDLPDEESDPTALEIQSLASYPLVPALGVSYEF